MMLLIVFIITVTVPAFSTGSHVFSLMILLHGDDSVLWLYERGQDSASIVPARPACKLKSD